MFREKIFDRILREELKNIAVQTIEKAKYKKQQRKLRQKIKSQENMASPEIDSLGYSPHEIPLVENRYLDYNFQKEIIKKKHMLDLMMQKKMSTRKKKIIKVYGKDMLAEMYLDLLNITDGEKIPGKILSPLS